MYLTAVKRKMNKDDRRISTRIKKQTNRTKIYKKKMIKKPAGLKYSAVIRHNRARLKTLYKDTKKGASYNDW